MVMATGANLLSLVVAAMAALLLPKILGVEEFGHWQLYLLYVAFVGVFQLGWTDGVLLRYGGLSEQEIGDKGIGRQFVVFLALQAVVSTVGAIGSAFIPDAGQRAVAWAFFAAVTVVGARTFIQFTFQATRRVREYSGVAALESLVFVVLVSVLLALGVRDFRQILLADLAAKSASACYAIWRARALVFSGWAGWHVAFPEARHNMAAGCKLMLAGFAGMAMISTVRLGIERAWSVAVFGTISLTLSIATLAISCSSAIGGVVFPSLRRVSASVLPRVYVSMRMVFSSGALVVMLVGLPLQWILGLWLPKYAQGLAFLPILLPVVLFEGMMAIIVSPFQKALRDEAGILRRNAVFLLLSALSTLLTVFVVHSINLSVVSITVLVAGRWAYSEYLVTRLLQVSVWRYQLQDVAAAAVFAVLGVALPALWAEAGFFLVVCFVLHRRRAEVAQAIAWLRSFRRGHDEAPSPN